MKERVKKWSVLFFLANNISVDIYNAFLNYRPLSGSDYIAEVSIMQIACPDA